MKVLETFELRMTAWARDIAVNCRKLIGCDTSSFSTYTLRWSTARVLWTGGHRIWLGQLFVTALAAFQWKSSIV